MRKALAVAKTLMSENKPENALSILRAAFTPEAPFPLLVHLAGWLKSLKATPYQTVKIAFLGGGTLNQLVDIVGAWLSLYGLHLEPYLPPYGTWQFEILREGGGLDNFAPDIIWLFNTSHDVEEMIGSQSWGNNPQDAADKFEALWLHMKLKHPGALIIQNNIENLPERVFGNLEQGFFGGGISFKNALNALIRDKAAIHEITIFDLSHLANSCGLWCWHDKAQWFNSKHPFALNLSGLVGFHVAKLVLAAKGLAKKVIVLDLDNTLWGGVVADDGLEGIALGNTPDGEAFVAFQSYLKALSRRGVVLAVASKNNEEIAKEVFTSHPAMVLSLDDIAAFKANWRNKADNIREIAEELQLGLDSFVFVDDNPAEVALVRQQLPMVETPELPQDPSLYVHALDRLAYFETLSFSVEDRHRTRMYKENSSRTAVKKSLTNLDEYLSHLEMCGEAGFASSFQLPRMTQLVNKSNQFHLTTTRYNEPELKAFSESDKHILRWFNLSDRFGDYGLIAVLLLRLHEGGALIDTWAMSCRVLERGMEEFILRDLLELCRQKSLNHLIGLYIPSKKNALVADLYTRLGFEKKPDDSLGRHTWKLNILESKRTTRLYIKKKD